MWERGSEHCENGRVREMRQRERRDFTRRLEKTVGAFVGIGKSYVTLFVLEEVESWLMYITEIFRTFERIRRERSRRLCLL